MFIDLRYVHFNWLKIIMKTMIELIGNKVDKSLILTKSNPKYTLLWLHGLGDSPAGFSDFFQM